MCSVLCKCTSVACFHERAREKLNAIVRKRRCSAPANPFCSSLKRFSARSRLIRSIYRPFAHGVQRCSGFQFSVWFTSGSNRLIINFTHCFVHNFQCNHWNAQQLFGNDCGSSSVRFRCAYGSRLTLRYLLFSYNDWSKTDWIFEWNSSLRIATGWAARGRHPKANVRWATAFEIFACNSVPGMVAARKLAWTPTWRAPHRPQSKTVFGLSLFSGRFFHPTECFAGMEFRLSSARQIHDTN